MFNFIGIFYFLLSIFLSVDVVASTLDFSGNWCWDKNSHVSAFSLVISKKSGMYKGSYFSVAHSGNRIDDNDLAFTFPISEKNIIKTKITDGNTETTGLVRIEMINKNKLFWSLLKIPEGDVYLPNKAFLNRC